MVGGRPPRPPPCDIRVCASRSTVTMYLLSGLVRQGASLETIANQLGRFNVVLTADTYPSVAVERGLETAAPGGPCSELTANLQPLS